MEHRSLRRQHGFVGMAGGIANTIVQWLRDAGKRISVQLPDGDFL
jgi:hypothetical protein